MIARINIVIPMAGLGSRFSERGYIKPKPFINVLGKPMIEHVLENLHLSFVKFILVVRKEHFEEEKEVLNNLSEKYNIEYVISEALTEGSACTVLLAKKIINTDVPLVVANSDQIVNFDFADFLHYSFFKDGSILTFVDESLDKKWSFVRLDYSNHVVEVKEKEAISNIATVGIYFFRKGSDFVQSAEEMINCNDRVNNEFYTCPVYNYLIKRGCLISIFNIEKNNMHGIGTPEDLNKYLSLKS